MANPNTIALIKKLYFILLGGLIVFALGLSAAILITSQSGYYFQDILFFEGGVITAIGIMFSLKQDSFGIGFSQTNNHRQRDGVAEITAYEMRAGTKKDARSDDVKTAEGARKKKKPLSLMILTGGVFMILYCVFTVQW